jgi:hypothetical protein
VVVKEVLFELTITLLRIAPVVIKRKESMTDDEKKKLNSKRRDFVILL